MNKLMGFYELVDMGVPSVPWKEYTGIEQLNDDCLWTIRSAVYHGKDIDLPRKVGVTASEALRFANELLEKLKGKGIVVYYPYFLANKSGTLNIFSDKIVIEAVAGDLWNMVTYSDRAVTIQYYDDAMQIDGDPRFLEEREINNLFSTVPNIKKTFRDDLLEGSSILLEWSFAQRSDQFKKSIGDEYLIFYEARTV